MEPSGREAFEILRFFRDTSPTEAELPAYLSGKSLETKERCELLKQEHAIVCHERRWILAPEHLSKDGHTLTWGNVVLFLDEDRYIINPTVTWMPDQWESSVGIAAFLYFFFSVACGIASMQGTTGVWIRDGVGAICCILLALFAYGDMGLKGWTRVQKWQLFALRTVFGLLLVIPIFVLNYLVWE